MTRILLNLLRIFYDSEYGISCSIFVCTKIESLFHCYFVECFMNVSHVQLINSVPISCGLNDILLVLSVIEREGC